MNGCSNESAGSRAFASTNATVRSSVTPLGPFSLALSAHGSGDLSRRFHGGVLTQIAEIDGRLERAEARQRSDGTVLLAAESAAALALLRFELALDDDHTPFLEQFASDALLGRAIRALKGLRPLRLATVSHSLLRALCGQLISAREARAIEARVIRRVSSRDPATALYAPPTRERLGELSPAEICRLGLAPRRAAALVRLCRTLDLERLRRSPSELTARKLRLKRMIGPWSFGVIALEGLGIYSHGLSGDLGLIKLCAVLQGRWADEADSARLLEHYGEWAGLASFYLLTGIRRGLVRPPGCVGSVALNARRLRSLAPSRDTGYDFAGAVSLAPMAAPASEH